MKRKAVPETPEVSDMSPKRNKSISEPSDNTADVEQSSSNVEVVTSSDCLEQDAPTSLDIKYIELQLPEPDTDDEASSIANSMPVARHAIKLEEPSEGSEYKISEGASERLINMYVEADKRNPNEFGIVHVYEDYRYEGVFEVIENEILDYQKALNDPKPSNPVLFEIVEALSFFMTGEYDVPWMHEDSARCNAILRLIGAIYLDILNRLNDLTVLQRDTFKNLGLIVGFMVLTNGNYPADQERWGNEVLRIARKWGLKLRGYGGAELNDDRKKEIAEQYLFSDAEPIGDVETEIKRYAPFAPDPMGGNRQDLSGITPEEVFAMNNPGATDDNEDEEDERYEDQSEAHIAVLDEVDVANADNEEADSAYNAVMKSLMGFNSEWPSQFKLPPTASRLLSLDYANDY